MSQQVLVKPQGIITEPNKVGQYPAGAFRYSSNVAIRSFGVVEQVRKFQSLDNNPWGSSRTLVGGCYAVTEGPFSVFLAEVGSVGTWRLTVYQTYTNGSQAILATTVPSPWNGYITNDGRTAILMMRNRIIINGTVRSFAFDLVENPNSPGVFYLDGPRNCGVYQTILAGRFTSTGAADDPAYLSPNAHFSATSVLRQIHADGYELMSPPAIPYDYSNLSTTLPQVQSQWQTKADLTSTGPGSAPHKHKIDIYRTREQSVGYDSVNNKYHPIATGSSFYLSMTTDWSANYFSFYNLTTDTTLPSTLGEALITNTSVGGAAALPLPPPPSCKTSAVFRGYAFYANRWDPAEFTLLNPYYWGFMEIASASTTVLSQGIGTRFTYGVQSSTNGNPTVTGFPNTTGIVPGQSFNVYRIDTGVLVTSNNQVLSKTATTVTGTTNVTYTGAVRVEFHDRIEVCGQNNAALNPQHFVSQLFLGVNNLNLKLDVASVGLEPIQAESPVGVYPNFVPTGGMTFRMRTNEPFTIRATNGQNYSPKLPEITDPVMSIPGKQARNSFAWSENNEPENVPPSNYAYVGQGEIYKVIATRDCLWFFCSDGLFRLSGSGGSVGEEYDWVIDPVDPSIVITNPACACVHREYVYAYTSRGVVSINSEGVIRELSDGRINPTGYTDFAMANKTWRLSNGATGTSISWNWVIADAANDDIWVRDRPDSDGPETIWVYNTKTDTWTARFPSIFPGNTPTCVTYNQYLESVVGAWANRAVVTMSNGVTGEYEQAQIQFQPIYGGKTGVDNYTQKHWQDISLSFDSPQSSTSATVRLQQGSVIAGDRNIPTTTNASNTMDKARIGFTVPRQWPALANSIMPDLILFSPSGGFDPIKLEGMAISFVEFTEQRVTR